MLKARKLITCSHTLTRASELNSVKKTSRCHIFLTSVGDISNLWTRWSQWPHAISKPQFISTLLQRLEKGSVVWETLHINLLYWGGGGFGHNHQQLLLFYSAIVYPEMQLCTFAEDNYYLQLFTPSARCVISSAVCHHCPWSRDDLGLFTVH